jgi:hypothetical protein
MIEIKSRPAGLRYGSRRMPEWSMLLANKGVCLTI